MHQVNNYYTVRSFACQVTPLQLLHYPKRQSVMAIKKRICHEGYSHLLACKKQSLIFRFDVEFVVNQFLELFDYCRSGRGYRYGYASVHHSHLNVHDSNDCCQIPYQRAAVVKGETYESISINNNKLYKKKLV